MAFYLEKLLSKQPLYFISNNWGGRCIRSLEMAALGWLPAVTYIGLPPGTHNGKQCKNKRKKKTTLIALRITPSSASSPGHLERATTQGHKHSQPNPKRRKHYFVLTTRRRKQIPVVFHSSPRFLFKQSRLLEVQGEKKGGEGHGLTPLCWQLPRCSPGGQRMQPQYPALWCCRDPDEAAPFPPCATSNCGGLGESTTFY